MTAITTLVIAEDNPKDFEFLQRIVAEWEGEYRVERAVNGLVALELALAQEEPLVISDIQMPQMNGIDFAKALWARKPQAKHRLLEPAQGRNVCALPVTHRPGGNGLRLRAQVESARTD